MKAQKNAKRHNEQNNKSLFLMMPHIDKSVFFAIYNSKTT